MLDIQYIREHSKEVEEAAKNKGVTLNLKKILDLDKQCKKLQSEVQSLQAEKNKVAREKNVEKGKKIKETLKIKEENLRKLKSDLEEQLQSVPNPAAPDVKVGKSEEDNEVIKKHETPKSFDFTPKDHLELGEFLDVIDVKRASKVSGTRFGYLKNEGALLELALVQLAMEMLLKEGFKPVIPPVLIKRITAKGLGYFEGKENEEYYWVNEPSESVDKGLYLVGTAEHSVVPMHRDEILEKKILPLRYVAFSSAFRREAGSYGKDVKGIFRVHQFNKVEMVSFATSEESDKEHEYLLSLEEKLLQLLEIPYQVVKMCTADLGFPAARKYDIEAWFPSQNKYREVTSTSTTTDFQARRLNIKYQEGREKKFAHILNGTAFSDRPLIAILENHQKKDGSVAIPKALQKYTGFKEIKPKN